jgi:GDP-L-fucose synthase
VVPGRIFIAGHRGLLGSALVRELARAPEHSLITRSRAELDLRDQTAVKRFFGKERPEIVLLAAAKVGGIGANSVGRWDFLYENLLIQNNVIGCCLEYDVTKLVVFGSSCIYPPLADQPLKEEYLLTGPLEPTNEPYAIAKIAGLKLVETANSQYARHWLSIMPTNLYGPGDNFDLNSSHVLPAMIRKFHEGKMAQAEGSDAPVTLWGTGSALREFLHVDDAAAGTRSLMEAGFAGLYNLGSGQEISIRDLASLIADVVGYDGPIEWDASKPDGTPRKLLDSTKIRSTGWVPRVKLREGIVDTYAWYRAQSEARTSR